MTEAAVGTAPARGPARVAWLFRHGHAGSGAHPLLPLLRLHHGIDAGLELPGLARPAAAPPAAPAATQRIDAAAIQHHVDDLPSLPQALLDAMTLLRNENTTAAELARCIQRDQSLTARTLRVANSAFYGSPGRVSTVRGAIDLLGQRAVGSLLVTSAVATRFSTAPGAAFDLRAFWTHSMATALTARGLARLATVDVEAAFIGGLLHDIGRLALVAGFADETEAMLRHAQAHDLPTQDAEREVLGLEHAAVGAWVASHWRFPPDVVEAILNHHAPLPGSAPMASVTDLVHLADALAHGLDLSARADEAVPAVDAAAWQRLDLAGEQILPVLATTAAEVSAVCESLLA